MKKLFVVFLFISAIGFIKSKAQSSADGFKMWAPNAFTPNNGDTLNETFGPIGDDINPANYEMFIFDRWGNLTYHTTRLDMPWNGKYRNSEKFVPQDAYVYLITTIDSLGIEHPLKGTVNVILGKK